MSALAQRLREVIAPAGGGAGSAPRERPAASLEHAGWKGDWSTGECEPVRPDRDAACADVLDGSWCGADGARFLVIDRVYRPGYRHGDVVMADALPPTDGTWPGLSLLAGVSAGSIGGRLLFIDLETTGLAGGAGSYAFLVGCGWFEGGTFRTRQFFLASFGAERALLAALAEHAEPAGALVTYNGKSFDLPLIETRFVLHRLRTSLADKTHLDMLHPARRLWRPDAPPQPAAAAGGSLQSGCRLSAIEQAICGHRREADVPGFEIPARYFHYVRSGDARPLAPVLEHNRLDLLSLALLTARAARLVEEGAGAARGAREALGLGRLYEAAGLSEAARESYARAVELAVDSVIRAEALRAYAVLLRRDRRFDEASAAWRAILQLRRCPEPIRREAAEALAVHHEHRLRDPRTARTLALEALRLPASPGRRAALHHRLARLDRKLDASPQARGALF